MPDEAPRDDGDGAPGESGGERRMFPINIRAELIRIIPTTIIALGKAVATVYAARR
ncbi:hypothetical protein ACFQS1_19465 [Paractinoplanes rhizophilus]|uniref:Uncharacterized protein n=1 Tax=Paractinoplanes rhizophilus TaxID=1416877 RepID=A0ABW2HWP3_9ACTN